jgi:hypothetical protein
LVPSAAGGQVRSPPPDTRNPPTHAPTTHTQVNLPDDRVIIVSGFLDDPVRQSGKPAPSIDVFDYKSRRWAVLE